MCTYTYLYIHRNIYMYPHTKVFDHVENPRSRYSTKPKSNEDGIWRNLKSKVQLGYESSTGRGPIVSWNEVEMFGKEQSRRHPSKIYMNISINIHTNLGNLGKERPNRQRSRNTYQYIYIYIYICIYNIYIYIYIIYAWYAYIYIWYRYNKF